MNQLILLGPSAWWGFGLLPWGAIGDLSSSRWWAIVLGCLFAVVALTLLVASWTKWGQTKSLTKCIAIAFVAHIWLLVYAYGTRIASPGIGEGVGGGVANQGVLRVMLNSGDSQFPSPPPSPLATSIPATAAPNDSEEDSAEESSKVSQDDAPELSKRAELDRADLAGQDNKPDAPAKTRSLNAWEKPVEIEQPVAPVSIELPAPTPQLTAERPQHNDEPLRGHLAANRLLADLTPDLDALEAYIAESSPTPILPAADTIASNDILPAIQDGFRSSPNLSGMQPLAGVPTSPLRSAILPPETSATSTTSANRSTPPEHITAPEQHSPYQNRFAPNRMEIVRAGGGDERTETAVEMALEWLARAQSPGGGWDASSYGAGHPGMVGRPGPDGEYRQNAGVKADTAMSGLAVLAFLGAGHHHRDGRHADTVANGLRYLLSQQLPSGDMSGRDQIGHEEAVRFARMYSHGMASLAIAEAYAITRDEQLLPAVRSACEYSLRAMNPRSGGWRYDYPTDDPGDTSQFGWQAMLLHSAASAGAAKLPHSDRTKMERFLDSVATGRARGLATYRPPVGYYDNSALATPSMTAEAMASRLLLGFPVSPASAMEAQQMILSQPPGVGQDNFYYWYYATLAMYQLRNISDGTHEAGIHQAGWKSWNDALKMRLCSTQVANGPNEGSWNPGCVWGNYGGRVYTTALGALCLEVYYRYLPMYRSTRMASPWPASDPRTRSRFE